jgi:hypothetical protein
MGTNSGKDYKECEYCGLLIQNANSCCKRTDCKVVSAEKVKRPCRDCGKEIGNDVFTCCDDCWDIFLGKKESGEKSEEESELEAIVELEDYIDSLFFPKDAQQVMHYLKSKFTITRK